MDTTSICFVGPVLAVYFKVKQNVPQKCLLPSTSCKGSLRYPAHIDISARDISIWSEESQLLHKSTSCRTASFCVHVLGFQVTQQAVMHTVTFSYTHLLLGVCCWRFPGAARLSASRGTILLI